MKITVLTPLKVSPNIASPSFSDIEKYLGYLRQCIDSVQSQILPSGILMKHLIIVDGIAHKKVLDFLSELKSDILAVYHTHQNLPNPATVRNCALDKSEIINSDYCMLLDADDQIPVDRISRTIKEFLDPTVVAVSSNFRLIDENNNLIESDFDSYYAGLVVKHYSDYCNDLWKLFIILDKARWFNLCGYTIRTKALLKSKFRNVNSSEDMWLHTDLFCQSNSCNRIKLLMNESSFGSYRIHNQQYSSKIKLKLDKTYCQKFLRTFQESKQKLLSYKLASDSIDNDEYRQLQLAHRVMYLSKLDKLISKDPSADWINLLIEDSVNDIKASSMDLEYHPITKQILLDQELL